MNDHHFIPFSEEAEMATLGSILIDSSVLRRLRVFLKGDDFFLVRHQHIWQAILRVAEREDDFDHVVVVDELRNMGRLEDVGGHAYVLHLVNVTPSSIYAEVYGHLVERAALRRRLLTAGDEIKAIALDEDLPVERVKVEAKALVLSITEHSLQTKNKSMKDLMSHAYDDVTGKMEAAEEIEVGLKTGLKDLDSLVTFRPKNLIYIAGRPGMGKTSKLLTIALNQARQGKRIFLATLEMNADEIANRLNVMTSGLLGKQLDYPKSMTAQEYSRFVKVVGENSLLPIIVNDQPRMTPDQIRNAALDAADAFGGLDEIMIDYVGLMRVGVPKIDQDEVGKTTLLSHELKAIAGEFNVPLVSACQLNRNLEQRKDKRPMLSDLRYSGDLEQDADIVIFIYRDEVYNEATEFPNLAELIVAKHRNGPTGTVTAYFEKTLTLFRNAHQYSVDLSML